MADIDFQPNGDRNLVTFGTRFMKTYVTTFDFDNKQITLGKSVDAPVETTPETSELWLTLSWIALALNVIVIATLIFFRCRSQKKEKDEHVASEYYASVDN